MRMYCERMQIENRKQYRLKPLVYSASWHKHGELKSLVSAG